MVVLICFRSRPLLEPVRRPAGFTGQGRVAGPEPRAGKLLLPEHGEDQPLGLGFLMVLGLRKARTALPESCICFW